MKMEPGESKVVSLAAGKEQTPFAFVTYVSLMLGGLLSLFELLLFSDLDFI